MIAKVNDRDVTAKIIQAMTGHEYKAFENRLRAMAKAQGLNISKYTVLGGQHYLIANAGRNTIEPGCEKMFIIEVKNYLYEVTT